MPSNSLDGMYFDFHTPLVLKNLIDQLIGSQSSDRNSPTPTASATSKEWISQPRAGSNDTTEVITARFKLPLSVSELSFDILRVPCQAEAWYQDRQNNWRQILDQQRSPITVSVQASSASSWYPFSTSTYPIVAQAVQIRITRTVDPQFGNNPYVVGLKNTLIRRNVYDRAQGRLPFEEEQDPLGNVINKYVSDWDAAQAIDDKPFTFWKSAAMPDPQAVCSLFLDTRDSLGRGQYMDGLFLDPVYSNQKLNIYYSNDDEVGQPRLSPITMRPEQAATEDEDLVNDLNTDWRSKKGRWDTSTFPAGTSRYRIMGRWGPMVSQDLWVGIEWVPDFDGENPPPTNPVLLESVPSSWITDQYAPTILYDSGAGAITLRLHDGTTTLDYSAPISPLAVKGSALRIVVGWTYAPDTIYISVQDRLGNQLALLEEDSPSLPPSITLDGQVGFSNFRGMFTAHVINKESYRNNADLFLVNPTIYVDPDPVLVNPDGTIPSTTLDNALFAVDWTLQEHGTGGLHESAFSAKMWQPIFANYITRRGKMFFPQPISAKYLKLEFTGLTEESYPVYDAGISVKYQVFPVSVQQTQTTNHPGLLGTVSGLLTVGATALTGVMTTVNWLNPQTVATAINSVFGPVYNPVTVQSGTGYVSQVIPGTNESSIYDSSRTEASSPYIYRRGALDPTALAASQIYYSGFTDWSQTLVNGLGLVGNSIADSFTPLKTFVTNPTATPVQGNDWWIFPGATLKMPAVVMNGLTALTETVLGRAPTTETRMRFTTNSVHRYETRVVKRDAAIAYFTGVREVQPLLTTYLNACDPAVFAFDNYSESQGWVFDNTRLTSTQALLSSKVLKDNTEEVVGPITTLGRIYETADDDFDMGIDNWSSQSGVWEWDTETLGGRWYPGAAKTTAEGADSILLSSLVRSFPQEDISEGQSIIFKVYARWSDLSVVNNQPAIQLGLVTYSGGEVVDDTIVLDEIVYSNWAGQTDSSSNENDYMPLSGTWVVPPGIDGVRIRLIVTEHATYGSVWFDTVTLTSGSPMTGSIYQSFDTVSPFAKLSCTFSDSGAVRSNSMWARQQEYGDWETYALADSPDNYPGGKFGLTPETAPALNADQTPYSFPYPNQQAYVIEKMAEIQREGGIANIDRYRIRVNSNINSPEYTQLAFYTSWISLDLFTAGGEREESGANWSDSLSMWSDDSVSWGSPDSLVRINIDSQRSYGGQRVLHFSREAGAGEVGIRVRQWTNFVPNAVFRICARWYKPFRNTNTIKVRLRRISDGVIIYEEEIISPPVGYWHEFATKLQQVPSGTDQTYNVELVTLGDSEDELYLSDLWVEISHVRYFVSLGNTLYDVTDLRYADTAIVSCPVPVTNFSVEARIYSPRAHVGGCKITPVYLK